MATLGQIRNRVGRKVQNPDFTGVLSASVVEEEINRSIRFYQNYRFYFNEARSTITLTADSNVVPSIPSDLLSPLYVNALMVIDDDIKVTLQKLSPTDFFNIDNEQTGRPEYYTYRDNQFLLIPVPEQNYELEFRYLKSYADLSGDSDSNDFTENAEDLIMIHTVKNIYAEDKQDPASASAYQTLEDQELSSLMTRSNDYNSTGYLSNYSILDCNY